MEILCCILPMYPASTAPLRVIPVLVTALNPLIGYLKAAEIAKRAYSEGRDILDVAEEMTDYSREALSEYLDPLKLTEGGVSEA